jgi:SAM-dependent methyltransferase
MQTVEFNHMALRAGDRVLDLGCGEGRHVIATGFAVPVHCIGVDLSLEDLLTAAGRLAETGLVDGARADLTCADALRLPFANDSFDVIICSEVLEHIADYPAVLREIRRLLKAGGVLAASVPRYWPERLCWALSDAYHANEGGHIRIFRSGQLKREVEACGMTRYRRHWAHALHSPFWWLKCLFWEQQETSRLVALYHRFLVWDLMERPRLTQWLEALLNPLMGKSVVMYFRKGVAG